MDILARARARTHTHTHTHKIHFHSFKLKYIYYFINEFIKISHILYILSTIKCNYQSVQK